MRKLVLLTVGLVMIPASAMASDLEELLERGHEASYSAEQIITCSNPDGVADAVVRLSQSGGDLHVAAPVSSDVEITTGYGGWTLSQAGSVVSSTELDSGEDPADPRYTVDDGTPAAFLGRRATQFEMRDGDLLRARLIFDNETGALLKAATFTGDGEVHCERRFITFDPTPPTIAMADVESGNRLMRSDVETALPEELAGFSRLDVYSDEDGFAFGYYSDGFFSFAVFETPSVVALGEGSQFQVDHGAYEVSYSPGQVTYVWETRSGGLAMIGDLPPDMHEAVLTGLPAPERRGWLGRVWKSLFG